ncbi:hypothetical protein BASA81_000360 [Batrachochytrium salamandrivorans]|nr:hypothetical protein BASA81_000360 [Batrachochytrium salamandrivorans]
MPPFYVALLHVVPQQKYAVEVCQVLKNTVNDNGGLVRKINNAGRRPLPTPFKAKMGLGKQKFANIVTVEFMANPKCALTAMDMVRKMDYCMRSSLLRADELLLCRPPRPVGAPKGCIQDWTPEGEPVPSPALLERRSVFESEFVLMMKEKVQSGQRLYEEDLRLPQEYDLLSKASAQAAAAEATSAPGAATEAAEEEEEDVTEDYSAFGMEADDGEEPVPTKGGKAGKAGKGGAKGGKKKSPK